MRIISGGQTGVDRAALDVALSLGLACGGFCPRGRLAEDGRIPDHYPLTELPSRSYAARTRANVQAADATLILAPMPLQGGTRLTFDSCAELGRPCLVVDPRDATGLSRAQQWLEEVRPRVLNVAGPRESQVPGISQLAFTFLHRLLAQQLHGSEGRR